MLPWQKTVFTRLWYLTRRENLIMRVGKDTAIFTYIPSWNRKAMCPVELPTPNAKPTELEPLIFVVTGRKTNIAQII